MHPTKAFSIGDLCDLNNWKSRSTYYNHLRRGTAPQPDFYIGPYARFTLDTILRYQERARNGDFATHGESPLHRGYSNDK
jgi:hypothetical protein